MASNRSARGLDWLNFFVADMQTGFGPFVAVYLTAQAWTEWEIGLVLSVGTLTGVVSQLPAGLLVDATPRKRLAVLVPLLAIPVSALLLVIRPTLLTVTLSEILHGVASCVLAPAIAAVSLALVGRHGLGERLGRNARYASVGNGVAAAVLGLAGTYVSGAAVFWVTAALAIPSLVALSAIRDDDLLPRVQPSAPEGGGWRGIGELLARPGVPVFAACCGLFTLSNAAMLPLAGAEVTRNSGDEANLVIAACIVLPQLVVAVISPGVGRLAERRGRRVALLLGFGALPLRGALLALVSDPWVLILVQALDGISAAVLGVLLPLLAADLTRGTNRFNLCMGMFGLAVGLGGTLSTAVAGAAASWFGPGVAFAMLGGAGLLSFLLVLFAMPETLPIKPRR